MTYTEKETTETKIAFLNCFRAVEEEHTNNEIFLYFER